MAVYISLLQFTDQGIRNVKDTTKRAAAAAELGQKMGVKLKDVYWTLGLYDLVLIVDADSEEAMTAFSLKLAGLGNVKTQTMRAFSGSEMESILGKLK